MRTEIDVDVHVGDTPVIQIVNAIQLIGSLIRNSSVNFLQQWAIERNQKALKHVN